MDHLLGAASGWGAQRHETAQGPTALAAVLGDFETLRAPAIPEPTLPGPATWAQVRAFNEKLSERVKSVIHAGNFPIILGGDHAIAMGTWWGVARGKSCIGALGLIWIDAHMDAHTPQTSPSQAMHGMPIAGLLGYGQSAWGEDLKPAIRPEHIVLIGARSFEVGEAALLAHLGVTIYFMSDVEEMGFEAVLAQAQAQVTRHTHAFGISIDLDGFDPIDAPGVGSPEPDGLRSQEVLPCLRSLWRDPKLAALEIVEYNPARDIAHKTRRLVEDILIDFKGERPNGAD